MLSTPIVSPHHQRHSLLQNMSQDDQLPHLLSLKVMRLSRPHLTSTIPIYYETAENSPIIEGLESLNISDLTASHPIEEKSNGIEIRDFGLSQMLKLPSAFGNIYLGESFSTLVSINNESPFAVHQVDIKVELQTSSQRFVLSDITPLDILNTNHNITVSHEIKELGVHILVCSVHYTTPENRKRNFRKFYKFQVSNPLAVKTKLNNMLDGRVFLESQIQNVSASPMYLERMKFEPSEHFQYEDLNYVVDGKESVFGDAYIQSQDVRQYLYVLSPKASNNDRISRTTNALGKLDIVWRSYMGDMGRLQTSQLTRKAPILEDLEIQPFWLEEGPVKIILEQPFKLGIRIRNHSNENMKLVLNTVKVKMGSVLLSGLSTRQLGEVGPNQTTETQLEYFPLTPGLQRVGGLKIVDLLSGYTKDVDHICDIFVLSHPTDTFETSL
ncbi:uncharacterized protein BX663DRAFT_502921 [Cokeromyces recurvatus]|uniref:uncharacterized protein n=1 Tax=Cokeromyces recurvatus TaxID=90255 RepID=UPI00221F459A|nr:uncharacterized protein BX663DRAFT_502921 [Cokeromyces recurvatus]KAI7904601.1 hypothetical protein BX663DRAFT_502921 [Cokeromyces recurvatus]